MEEAEMSYRVSVTLEDIKTGKKELLYEKERCKKISFKKVFPFEGYDIQLRLDWDDLVNGEPRLDADIRDKKTGKMIKKGKWHHTDPIFDINEGRIIYNFVFETLHLRLGVIKTMVIKFTANAVLVKKE